MARKITPTGTTPAAVAFDHLTVKGQAFMTAVGTRQYDFFDDGMVEHSGNYGSNLAGGDKGMSGVMNGTRKAGLWHVTAEQDGDAGEWWSLTALGAEVALHAASLVAPKPAVKVCKKDASHGEHRVTKTGSYCYPCDRIAAEAQKAAKKG